MDLTNKELELRKFGYVVGGVFLLVAAINWKFGGGAFPYFFAIGAILVGLALLHPKSLSLVYTLWMKLALVLNTVVTTVILSVIFYFILSPTATVARILGKKFLDLSFKSSARTYWQKREKEEAEAVENQF